MQSLRIRRYLPSDNPVVWELHWLGLAELGVKPIITPFDQDLYDIENVYLKDGDFIVGEVSGKVVAMGGIKKIDADTAEVKRMRVQPDFQGRGFGQAIIKELEKRAKKMGYKKMVLDTSKEWIKAQRFYEKNGYKETSRNSLHGRYDAIFYEKYLR